VNAFSLSLSIMPRSPFWGGGGWGRGRRLTRAIASLGSVRAATERWRWWLGEAENRAAWLEGWRHLAEETQIVRRPVIATTDQYAKPNLPRAVVVMIPHNNTGCHSRGYGGGELDQMLKRWALRYEAEPGSLVTLTSGGRRACLHAYGGSRLADSAPLWNGGGVRPSSVSQWWVGWLL